ncbi:glycoside hydrolase family 27 protein [Halostagnicola sp. A56]|uniref:glycoside hydrolase family 27 protein n=1 Tax=Halostagnicola sp. A56 TaxID=1495067 RepID=UPI001E4EEDA7|nr:glycoside hydrolase family 27 protein [Halostagnicola sp. A56]
MNAVSATGPEHSLSTTVSGSSANESVPHQNPDEYDDEVDAGSTASWLENQLSNRLEDSSIALSDGQYELAQEFVDEEYEEQFEQYVDVEESSEGTDATAEGNNSPSELFNESGQEQQQYATHLSEYNETREEYDDAVAAGDDERARNLARELNVLAAEIEDSSGELAHLYENLSVVVERDFSDLQNAKRGLKLGIYQSAGTTTCEGLPGSLGYEAKDAQSFADWGVDFLKYDNCGDHYGLSAIERYTRMHNALEATDRDILLSICEWGDNDPWMWAPEVGGNLWRTTGDIKPLWSAQEDLWGNGIIDIIDQNEPLAEYAGPGRWNDADMLVIGVDLPEYPNLNDVEDRTHFGMWALMASPLIAGNDIRNMSDETLDVLTNEEIIAINQDPAGNQAVRIQQTTGQDGLSILQERDRQRRE